MIFDNLPFKSKAMQFGAGGILGIFLIIMLSLSLKAQWTIQKISAFAGKETEYKLYNTFSLQNESSERLDIPTPQTSRQNFLIVGMRGFGVGDGDLLTDTMLLVSIKKDSNQVAFISIPRDLFIQIPYKKDKVKINELYTLGYEKGGETLAFSALKNVISQLSGVYIDGMVRVDFAGFQKLIDNIGGVDVYLDKPFQELAQWKGEGGFYLPQGQNHLDGQTALYFVRSRFSTSDFDRARRQQLLILAIKEKLTGLGVLSNPIKLYNILDIIGNHVKTDIPLGLTDILSLVREVKNKKIRHLVLSNENYLFSSTSSTGSYILLPKEGDYANIRDAIKNIFKNQKVNP